MLGNKETLTFSNYLVSHYAVNRISAMAPFSSITLSEELNVEIPNGPVVRPVDGFLTPVIEIFKYVFA